MGSKRLTNTYMSTLCLEISMLLQAGISVNHGIEMMLDDEPDDNAKKVLQALHSGLEGGSSLSDAMKNSGYFPPYIESAIEVGEKTGRLAEALKALAEHYERQERIFVSVKNATLYPAVLLGIMIVSVMILITQVLPIFNDVFARMGAQMSPFALQLMRFGDWFRDVSVVVAAIFGTVLVAVLLAWSVPAIREGIGRSLKKSWGDFGVFGKVAATQFASSMATTMSSGLSIEESISLAASFNSDSKALNKKYEKCLGIIKSGESLHVALRESGVLSSRDARMLALGDQSGMADTAMAEIARRSDRTTQDEIAALVSRIEPTLVIIMSTVVSVILLSAMLPLVGIMTSIG